MAESLKKIAVVAYGEEINNRHVAGYDHVVAVNRASGAVFAEYTVCADYQALSTFVPQNAQTVFVADAHNAERIRANLSVQSWRVLAVDPPGEYSASIFIAIWFAANHLAASEIDVFGARWSGTTDADGYTDSEQRRSPRRWKRERKLFEQARKKLCARGVVLRRLLLEDITDV